MLLGILLLFVNILLFINTQVKNSVVGDVWNYKHIKQQAREMQENYGEDEQLNQIIFYNVCAKDYRKSYPEKIEKIEAAAKETAGISIFQNQASSKNIQKTWKDFEKLKGVTLEEGEDFGPTSVIKHWEWTVCLLFFGIFVLGKFSMKQKSCIYPVVYGSYGGRGRLRIKQVIILLSSVMGMGAILLGSTLLTSILIYGKDVGWNRAVQSIELFQNVTLRISLWQLMLLVYIAGVLGVLAGLYLIWTLLLATSNWRITMVIAAVLYGIGYMLEKLVGVNDKAGIFRCTNVFNCLKPGENIIHYQNFTIFGITLGRTQLMILFMLFLLFLCVTACILLVYVRTDLSFLSKKKHKHCGMTFGKNIITMEFYQLLIQKKGLLLIVVFVLVARFLSVQSPVIYSIDQYAMNQFYEDYGGKMDENFYEKLENMKQEYQTVMDDYKISRKQYKEGKISDEKFEALEYTYKNTVKETGIILEIEDKVRHLEKLEKQGKNAWFINERGYNRLFDKGLKRQGETGVMIIAVLLFSFGIFTEFKQKGWRYHVRTSQYGRKSYFWKKAFVAVSCIFVSCILIYGIDFYSIQEIFPMEHLDAPIHSLKLGECHNTNGPIWLYLALHYLKRMGVWCMFGLVSYTLHYFVITRREEE